jgi:ABC-type polar amino acid transport system ATPase subunit
LQQKKFLKHKITKGYRQKQIQDNKAIVIAQTTSSGKSTIIMQLYASGKSNLSATGKSNHDRQQQCIKHFNNK